MGQESSPLALAASIMFSHTSAALFIPRVAKWAGDTLSAQDPTGKYKPGLIVGHRDALLGVLFGQAKQLCRIGGEWDYDMQPALNDLRTRIDSSFRTYYINSTQHTWTNHDYMGPVSQNVVGHTPATGVPLKTWISQLIRQPSTAPIPALQVGPGPTSY